MKSDKKKGCRLRNGTFLFDNQIEI